MTETQRALNIRQPVVVSQVDHFVKPRTNFVALSMIYGRVYCSYACPQMIFSETALALEERLRKWVTKKFIAWLARRL